MSIDVAAEGEVVAVSETERIMGELAGAFPDVDCPLEQTEALLHAWIAFHDAVAPLKQQVHEWVEIRADSLPVALQTELSLVNEFTATGNWNGRRAPVVDAVQVAEFSFLGALIESGTGFDDSWRVVHSLRVLANGGVLRAQQEEQEV